MISFAKLIYMSKAKSIKRRDIAGRLYRFSFLFKKIIIADAKKQKTAQASYKVNAHKEQRKNTIKKRIFSLCSYFVRYKSATDEKNNPHIMRDDAEIQNEPSYPKGKNK